MKNPVVSLHLRRRMALEHLHIVSVGARVYLQWLVFRSLKAVELRLHCLVDT